MLTMAQTQPIRIQRHRFKGWRMPDNAIYVGRPTRFGNPFRPGMLIDRVAITYISGPDKGDTHVNDVRIRDVQHAVDAYRLWINGSPTLIGIKPPTQEWIQKKLRGKDLCCWCHPDSPCHADILLEVANRP